MITIKWTGKAVSVNKWHVVRRGRISPSREYEEFIDSLAWAIRAKMVGPPCTAWHALDMTMACDIGPLVDDQNLLKPVCDAIQRSKLLENDREIRRKVIEPATRHKRGQPDTIVIQLEEAAW